MQCWSTISLSRFWIAESNRGAFLALQQCWSVHLRIVVGENRILQAFWFPIVCLAKPLILLNFVSVNLPVQRRVHFQVVPVQDINNSSIDSFWGVPIKFFSQWRDCAEFGPEVMALRFSKIMSAWTFFLFVKSANYFQIKRENSYSNILCRQYFVVILIWTSMPARICEHKL